MEARYLLGVFLTEETPFRALSLATPDRFAALLTINGNMERSKGSE
jgi:hypothetical protein